MQADHQKQQRNKLRGQEQKRGWRILMRISKQQMRVQRRSSAHNQQTTADQLGDRIQFHIGSNQLVVCAKESGVMPIEYGSCLPEPIADILSARLREAPSFNAAFALRPVGA